MSTTGDRVSALETHIPYIKEMVEKIDKKLDAIAGARTEDEQRITALLSRQSNFEDQMIKSNQSIIDRIESVEHATDQNTKFRDQIKNYWKVIAVIGTFVGVGTLASAIELITKIGQLISNK